MRVGGHVAWLVEPATPDELREAWCFAREQGYVPRLLGGGANLIVAGGEQDAVVIATERMRRLFRPDPEAQDASTGAGEVLDAADGLAVRGPAGEREFWNSGAEGGEVDARLVTWCGASMPGVVRAAQELGWSGVEGLVGVPGNMGGGVAMNAGGRWGELWDVIELVRVLDENGELVDLPRAECTPGYRDGRLGGRVVVGCVLKLAPDEPGAVRARTREHLLEKNAVQPVTEWSSGCIFRNPDPEVSDGRSAGKLIDDCGGKALARGDATVSEKHANFIVNRGRATAEDVLGLIEDVRAHVREKSGVELVREVKVWFEDGDV